MTTRSENRLINRMDRERDQDPRAKFAHLFKVRQVHALKMRVFEAFYNAQRTPSALRATGVK